MRHIIIGNEGALCYITEVTVKIFKYTPETVLRLYPEDMKTGFNILREIDGGRVSSVDCRLYDAEDGTRILPILPTENVC